MLPRRLPASCLPAAQCWYGDLRLRERCHRNNFLNSGDPLAAGFGTEFAYIHTGLNGWSYNGTTLAISKRGSGLKDVLDPCIYKVSQTVNYTKMCEKYWSPSACIKNAHSAGGAASYWYDSPMNARTDSKTCSDGYCTCASTTS